MLRTLPLTTILSGSGSSPPSFVHNTGSGLLDPKQRNLIRDMKDVYATHIAETAAAETAAAETYE